VNSTPDPLPAGSAAASPPTSAVPQAAASKGLGAAGWILLVLALAAAAVSAWSAWQTQARVRELETELVKRQQSSSDVAAEARFNARQAQDLARETAAKLALLDARVAESSAQRTQIEELMQAVARTRDQNVLSEIESALRVAMQQSEITGSVEPLLLTLKQAEERLARLSQPQLDVVRRAVGNDLEHVKDAAVSDVGVLTARLDDVLHQVDELPLLTRPRAVDRRTSVPAAAAPAASAASAASADWADRWRQFGTVVWTEVRSLVRVTSIEQPEAMLVTPEQAYFLRENLKLRLLNARLGLLSRQYDSAQSDLRDVRAALERYFDRGARPVQAVLTQVRQVMAQTRQVTVPRPEATLAAIAAASARR